MIKIPVPHFCEFFLARAFVLVYHFCFVSSYNVQSHLDWWPKIDTIYCYSGELRAMFADTQARVVQSLTAHAPLRMTPVRYALLHTFYRLS